MYSSEHRVGREATYGWALIPHSSWMKKANMFLFALNKERKQGSRLRNQEEDGGQAYRTAAPQGTTLSEAWSEADGRVRTHAEGSDSADSEPGSRDVT
eukprot:2628032-Rhodomonas_salina.1